MSEEQNNLENFSIHSIILDVGPGALARNRSILLDAIDNSDLNIEAKENLLDLLYEARNDLYTIFENGCLASQRDPYKIITLNGVELFKIQEVTGTRNSVTLHATSGVNLYSIDVTNKAFELHTDCGSFRKILRSENLHNLADEFNNYKESVRIYYCRPGGIEQSIRNQILKNFQYFLEYNSNPLDNFYKFTQAQEALIPRTFPFNDLLKIMKNKYTHKFENEGFKLEAMGGQNIIGTYFISCYREYESNVIQKVLNEIKNNLVKG